MLKRWQDPEYVKNRPDQSGENNPSYGRKKTPKEIERMTGENNPMYGMAGELNPMWGKKQSSETKEKQRQKRLAYWTKKKKK